MVTVSSTSVCASAPGKVILCGEHAVVYGQPAIAGALSDLRIYVTVTPHHSGTIRVIMRDLPPTPVQVEFSSTALRLPNLQEPPTQEDANVIRARLSSLDVSMSELGVSAVTPLVYLLNRLVPEILATSTSNSTSTSTSSTTEGLEIAVSSQDLPVGAGLGSSAAFGVACAAALYRLRHLRTTGDAWPLGKPPSNDLETINQFAFYSEILLHGTPSGIDNAVSSFGGAIVYTKNVDTNETQMENLDMPPLILQLTHTHVPRSTKKLVAGVRAMFNQHMMVVQGMLDTMGAITRSFREILLSGDLTSHGDDLLTLVMTNQHLLRAVGVSHESLDYVCEVVQTVAGNDAACKLTGAGGGGCAMTLFRPGSDGITIGRAIEMALRRGRHSWNFSCFTSAVGGKGVLWISPEEFQEHESRVVVRDSDLLTTKRGLLIGAVAAGTIAAVIATRAVARRS